MLVPYDFRIRFRISVLPSSSEEERKVMVDRVQVSAEAVIIIHAVRLIEVSGFWQRFKPSEVNV